MAFVTDPDDLTRWQVAVDPTAETIAVKGLGAARDIDTPSDVAADTAGLDFDLTAGVNTITRNDGGNFTTDDYRAGGEVTVAGATVSANNGTYVILAVTSTVLTVENETGFTNDTDDETASLSGRNLVGTDGVIADADTLTSASSTFSATGEVAVDDALVVISGTGNIIGHYTVKTIDSDTSLTINETFSTTGGTGITFAVFNPTAADGPAGGNVGDGCTMQALYSFLKEEWRTFPTTLGSAPDLIAFTFPIESITREQFEIGGPTHSDWDFYDNDTRNLLRTGGWAQINVSGTTEAEYTGVITLGSLDANAQVYYQQIDADTDPTDFVLPGPVNQSILTYKRATAYGPGDLDFADNSGSSQPDTITRAAGSWITDNYLPGATITVANATVGANNGTYTVDSVSATVLTLTQSGVLTTDTGDTAATITGYADYRTYLKLFVRKKARSYAQSEIGDIGVTALETIVNRFPLAHVTDAAITVSDGELAGSAESGNTVYGTIDSVRSNSGDITNTTADDGFFEFTDSGALFTTTDQVEPGDVVKFTSGALSGEYYEIYSVDSATQLTLYAEPNTASTGTAYSEPSPETGVSYTVSTRRVVFENTDGNVGGTGTAGTFTSATVGNFAAAGVLGGDYLVITDGGATATDPDSIIGVYKITTVVTTTLNIDLTDNPDWNSQTTGNDVTFQIYNPGMFLQRKSELATQVIAATGRTLTFTHNTGSADVITASSGDFTTDGYSDGMAVTVTGTTNNNGTYIIDTAAATTLTLIEAETLTTEGPLSATATLNGETGFVRTLNAIDYPFNWRLFGNGGTLGECFQFLQKELRRASDIDRSSGTSRGDVTDLLMVFATPTGTGLNLFIDDLASSDANNATFTDLSGDSRNFAFLAGVTINLNTNITDEPGNGGTNKIVVFFTDPDGTPSSGDEFGTVGAIIVQDVNTDNMESEDATASPLSFTFDYDNNSQGGRTPGTDADVTIVCIGEGTAQYVQTTGTIERQNNNIFSLVASLERNYSNPV